MHGTATASSLSSSSRSNHDHSSRRTLKRESPMQVSRRQAARLLRMVLQGDQTRHATASIKSLVYHHSIRNKKVTMALICQTLKYLPIIKEVLKDSGFLKKRMKVQEELIYVMTFELLFGKEQLSSGDIENYVLSSKTSLRAALARLLIKKKVRCVEDLLCSTTGRSKFKYVRVNTLKIEVAEALDVLRKVFMVEEDDIVPGLLALPAEADMHNHPLVLNGSLLIQGKASCMPALALAPQANWVVLDACAAPGNKTVQLAALMNGNGTIFACEMNKTRIKRLSETVKICGACNVKILHKDFLELDACSASLSQVKAILLDPSCSGSGTANRRMDYLLPSSIDKKLDGNCKDAERVEKLAVFQEKALRFALSFPSVERIVYSTCSIYQRENEDVVKAVLEYAIERGFRLGCPIPKWPHRGFPVFEGAENLIRVEQSEDVDGFFIALFEREMRIPATMLSKSSENNSRRENKNRKRKRKCNRGD